jgi:hypothetical protein
MALPPPPGSLFGPPGIGIVPPPPPPPRPPRPHFYFHHGPPKRLRFVLSAPNQHEYSFGGELNWILFDGSAAALVKLLVVPIRPEDRAGRKLVQHQNSPKESQGDDSTEQSDEEPTLCLYNLPTEIHHLIFRQLCTEEITSHDSTQRGYRVVVRKDEYDETDEMLDVFHLSLTCRHFWHVGRTHIEDYYMSHLGRWTGENIVAVGWFHQDETGDNPPGLFTKKQEEKFARNRRREVLPWNLNHFIDDYNDNEEIDVDDILPDILTKPLLESKDVHQMLPADMLQVYRTVLPRTANFYRNDERWILRNLTTKEFVRADAIALKPEFINGPEIEHLGFGEVVLSRICWSHIADNKFPQDPNIHRGSWAGHKFDITTVARHQSESREHEWTDVSDEVFEHISRIWKKKFGDDWKDIVSKPREKKRKLGEG